MSEEPKLHVNPLAIIPPYAELNLSDIVTHLNRATRKARNRCANDDVTRAFLDAAMSLTDDLFAAPKMSMDNEDGEESRPTMKFLAAKQVLARAQILTPSISPTIGKFRNRWTAQRFFVADFISYALMARHWSLHMALSDSAKSLLTEEKNFVSAVHEVAYQDLLLVLELPAYRFQLLAAASAKSDPVVSEALGHMYQTLNEAWCELYTAVFDHYGFRFRADWSIEQFNIVMQSTAEGLGLRLLADTGEPIVDHATRTSILGKTALALFVAFVDTGDGRSLEEMADNVLIQAVNN